LPINLSGEARKMKNRMANNYQRNLGNLAVVLTAVLGAGIVWSAAVAAQDRLKTMPGYEQHRKMSREIPGSVKMGSVAVKWLDGGKAFEYRKDDRAYRYSIAERKAVEIESTTAGPAPAQGRGDSVLPLRRKPGARLFPPAQSDLDPEHDGHRGLPESRRSKPGRRSVRLRPGDEEHGPDRHS
jgi:hypothetical protein